MKRSLWILLGLLAMASSAPAFATGSSAASTAGAKSQVSMSRKAAVAECKKEGLIGKKLDACVKEKTESK